MSVAIVTGGSKGLGRALSAGLLERGWSVVIDARTASELHETAADLQDRHGRGIEFESPPTDGNHPARADLPQPPGRGIEFESPPTDANQVAAVVGDIRDPEHRRALVAAAAELGSLELVVNNAGGLGPSPLPALADYPLGELAELFDVNVVAPLALLQEALPTLRANRGTVVNITSDAAVEGYPGWGGYGATKAALEQASRVLAAEEPDVAVYWVDPGDMRTQMHQHAFPGEDISDRPEPETSVPGLLSLVWQRPPSGRYQVRELVLR